MVKLLGARKEAILHARDEDGVVVEEYRALYTTQALADAEIRMGKSVSEALGGFVTGKSGVREVALLLQSGLEADRRATGSGKTPVSFNRACEVLDMVGLTPAAKAIGDAITAVLQHGETPEEDLQAEDDPNA